MFMLWVKGEIKKNQLIVWSPACALRWFFSLQKKKKVSTKFAIKPHNTEQINRMLMDSCFALHIIDFFFQFNFYSPNLNHLNVIINHRTKVEREREKYKFKNWFFDAFVVCACMNVIFIVCSLFSVCNIWVIVILAVNFFSNRMLIAIIVISLIFFSFNVFHRAGRANHASRATIWSFFVAESYIRWKKKYDWKTVDNTCSVHMIEWTIKYKIMFCGRRFFTREGEKSDRQ